MLNNVTLLIKNAIFNEKYIPGTACNPKGMDFNHNLLLHGYDKAADEVSFLVHDTNRSLTVRHIPIYELEMAFYNNIYNCERNKNRSIFLSCVRTPILS